MADTSFERLSENKRIRIIEGAIREFADYGFDAASTNRIVKSVGISKGSLFNYFRSKDDLYLYLAEHALNRIVPIMRQRIENMPADILIRLRLVTEAIVDIYSENPLYYRFFMGIFDPGASHLQQKLLQKNAELIGFMDFFKGTDTSRFRLDEQSTFLLIKWLYTGIKQELFEIQAVQEDPAKLREPFLNRLEKVIDALKDGIYQS